MKALPSSFHCFRPLPNIRFLLCEERCLDSSFCLGHFGHKPFPSAASCWLLQFCKVRKSHSDSTYLPSMRFFIQPHPPPTSQVLKLPHPADSLLCVVTWLPGSCTKPTTCLASCSECGLWGLLWVDVSAPFLSCVALGK